MSDQAAPSKTPEQVIREALQALAAALSDAAGMQVVTQFQVLDENNPGAQPKGPFDFAKTEVLLDGDRNVLVPLFFDTGDLRVPQAVYDLHEKNVQEAMAYRKEMVQMLVDFVKSRRVG